MPRNFNKYQYETSPRKLEPEYAPPKTPKKPKKSTGKKRTVQKKQKAEEIKIKKRRVVAYLLIGFAVLFAISYRSSQIDEHFARIQGLRQDISDLDRENTQLEIAIANSTNLRHVEQQARELLGMQNLNSNQIVYVSLPKSDHIEPASEVIMTENTSVFRRILDGFMNIF
ncbi:MAG: hypothetical protein FWC79_04850 [Oscillospiraceae bacterium]|nr:hypothetical protein [Oscillospiraceae bacterium]